MLKIIDFFVFYIFCECQQNLFLTFCSKLLRNYKRIIHKVFYSIYPLAQVKIMQQSPIKHFELNEQAEWYPELLKTGCVVLKNILSKEEVDKAQDLFWEWLQNLESGIKRNDPLTWKNQNWPGNNTMGFFVSYGGCHTMTSWMIRSHPKVKEAFSKIWKTDKLITSFDTIISWRPWWNQASKSSWTPYVQNLHLDQNPHFKKGLKCVQGMVPLKRVRIDEVGGLQVVPGSNSQKVCQQIIKKYPSVTWDNSDWLQLYEKIPLMGKETLVECEAGDLILWDSRTVHGGKVCHPSQQWKKDHNSELVRLAVTVTMVPREWSSQQNLKKRKEYFEKRIGTTHWPHQSLKNPMGKMAPGIKNQSITYKFPDLTPQIQDLI